MPRQPKSQLFTKIASGTGPLHERIADAIEGGMEDGTYSAGVTLPSRRALAGELGVAVGTVGKAFDSLVRRGLVRGEVGRGTFVLGRGQTATPPGLIDLSRNAPPPAVDIGRLAEQAAMAIRGAERSSDGGYGDPAGWPEHRTFFSAWLRRNGVEVTPDEIVLTIGGQHAIHAAFHDLARLTKGLAVEPATFAGAKSAATANGLNMVVCDYDDEGLLPDSLEQSFRSGAAGAAYMMPTAQNPFGVHMGARRRRDIVAVCSKYSAPIVEDDAYGTLRDEGVPTLKQLAPQAVYYVTSTAKSILPFLRGGVLSPPPQRMGHIVRDIAASIYSAPPVSNAICAELFAASDDVRIRADLRRQAAQRQALAVERLSLATPPRGLSFHLWLPMPESSAEQLARRAIEKGIRLTPPDAPIVDARRVSGLRLCLGSPRELSHLAYGLDVIAGLINHPSEVII